MKQSFDEIKQFFISTPFHYLLIAIGILIRFLPYLRMCSLWADEAYVAIGITSRSFEEILTLHRLKVPALLRKTLHSTNPIESMFSMVRGCERNVKRARNSKMRQRWLAAILLYCEKSFRTVKGYRDINRVVINIEKDLLEQNENLMKAA